MSEKESRHFGTLLGQQITRPLIIFLMGELGAGKTCFAQGIARGLEVPDTYYVTSPSYSLINEYPGRLDIYHIDLYRLEDFSDFDDLGLDEILTSESVSVIEWAERLGPALPENRLDISIEIVDDATRRLILEPYGDDATKIVAAFFSKI